MADIVQEPANIKILLSSRQHVNVERYFEGSEKSLLYIVEVLPERTEPDIVRLIEGEIQRRRPKEYKDGESIFCKFALHPYDGWGKSLNNSCTSQPATPRFTRKA